MITLIWPDKRQRTCRYISNSPLWKWSHNISRRKTSKLMHRCIDCVPIPDVHSALHRTHTHTHHPGGMVWSESFSAHHSDHTQNDTNNLPNMFNYQSVHHHQPLEKKKNKEKRNIYGWNQMDIFCVIIRVYMEWVDECSLYVCAFECECVYFLCLNQWWGIYIYAISITNSNGYLSSVNKIPKQSNWREIVILLRVCEYSNFCSKHAILSILVKDGC